MNWAEGIRDLGFPIFVSLYLLLRLEPTIGKLDKTIRLQTILIAKMSSVDLTGLAREYGFSEREVRGDGK